MRRCPFAALLVGAGLLVYWNSFSGVFIFDDSYYVSARSFSQHPSSVWQLFREGADKNISTRPVVNFTLALNFALGGLHVWGYHAVNLIIHLSAALILFGILRRSFLSPALQEAYGRAVDPLSFVISLLWLIHPIQTQSVTYIIQRAESLMALFYLLTLYAVIRGVSSLNHPIRWFAASVLFCALGMASKGVMVTAPLTILFYDRVFIAGSWRRALNERWRLYACLAATWGVLLFLWIAGTRHIAEPTAGFSYKEVTPFQYLCTQPGVLLHYLRLVFWPHPLVLDYGWPVAKNHGAILIPAAALALIFIASLGLFKFRKEAIFLCAAFFLVLAPTSSFFPIADLAFEYRMYLPLAAVIALLVSGIYALLRRFISNGSIRTVLATTLLLTAATSLGAMTILRNNDYQNGLSIWSGAAINRPDNPRAQDTLGFLLMKEGRLPEALSHVLEAVRIGTAYPGYHNSAGILFARMGRYDEAIKYYTNAIKLVPEYALAHFNMGVAYAKLGNQKEAIRCYEEALRLKPDYTEAHYDLGVEFMKKGDLEGARTHYTTALGIDPEYAEPAMAMGYLEFQSGHPAEAVSYYAKAVRLEPQNAEAQNNLASAFALNGDRMQAIEHYKKALEIDPGFQSARENLKQLD